jgi:hypothetical protein
MDQSCRLLLTVEAHPHLPAEVKYATLMPCLFTLRACYSYAKFPPLRIFFMRYFNDPVFLEFFNRVQEYKRIFVRPGLSEDHMDRLYRMSKRAQNEWDEQSGL